MALSKDSNGKGICTASKKYQDTKLGELDAIKDDMTEKIYQKRKDSITEKACLCVGLANASYMDHEIKIKGEAQGVVICPGPNMAYFNQEISLEKMVNHIYGRVNVMPFENRPNLFIKEIELYFDYLKKEIENHTDITNAVLKKWNNFKANLVNGIEYYENLLSQKNFFDKSQTTREKLDLWKKKINLIEVPVLEIA